MVYYRIIQFSVNNQSWFNFNAVEVVIESILKVHTSIKYMAIILFIYLLQFEIHYFNFHPSICHITSYGHKIP